MDVKLRFHALAVSNLSISAAPISNKFSQQKLNLFEARINSAHKAKNQKLWCTKKNYNNNNNTKNVKTRWVKAFINFLFGITVASSAAEKLRFSSRFSPTVPYPDVPYRIHTYTRAYAQYDIPPSSRQRLARLDATWTVCVLRIFTHSV